jgi:hypothetical protein
MQAGEIRPEKTPLVALTRKSNAVELSKLGKIELRNQKRVATAALFLSATSRSKKTHAFQ